MRPRSEPLAELHRDAVAALRMMALIMVGTMVVMTVID
jgi:hypothetical protein